MADHFLVLASDKPGGNPEAYYVSDGKLEHIKNFDPREHSDLVPRIVMDIEIDPDKRSTDKPRTRPPFQFTAIQAIASLDAACHGHQPNFRRALAHVFNMGMRAQRELDHKAAEEAETQKRTAPGSGL